jgi:hypothetical protein
MLFSVCSGLSLPSPCHYHPCAALILPPVCSLHVPFWNGSWGNSSLQMTSLVAHFADPNCLIWCHDLDARLALLSLPLSPVPLHSLVCFTFCGRTLTCTHCCNTPAAHDGGLPHLVHSQGNVTMSLLMLYNGGDVRRKTW